ncbi:MAG TPA: hypothetical protein VF794_03455 [Archangium sp.]|jgi:hypothetical protein|uniref:hypothetical protein n=1 Tax=Archangium sp. TaxID=1872627 RepID=UPI002ED7F174
MKSLLTLVASYLVATAPGGEDTRQQLRVDLESAALSALPSSCFRTPAMTPKAAPASERSSTWVLHEDGERGSSVLEAGAPSFVLGDAGWVTLPERLSGAGGHFSFQGFEARLEGTSVITRHTWAELVLTPGEESWTGTLTLSARDGCRGGACRVACEVVLPFTATPFPLHLASAAR